MPTVNVFSDVLFTMLNKTFTSKSLFIAPKEFEDLCFEFGIELEEVTSEQKMNLKNEGKADKASQLSDRPIYRIDIPANRYDMLCVEGISLALKAFLGISKAPMFQCIEPRCLQQLHVQPETASIRPFVVAAILRDITFTQDVYDSFIELQDKLHQNICRKRTLVAIGTHDLDTIQGPFTYEARLPRDIHFVPLNQSKEMNGEELMEFYASDRKLCKFLPIIQDAPRYPVIYDANQQVLSLPPIINSNHSKIKLSTKNVLIECTATDLTKAKIVLNTMVCMFSMYCKKPFTCEPVQVVMPDGSSDVYPKLQPRTVQTTVDYINRSIGISISANEMIRLLSKMSLDATNSNASHQLDVKIPPTRSDILHACDVMEDVAIAYGFNNIEETHPKSNTVAAALPMNQLTDKIRTELALSGYTEALTLTLCSLDENFEFLNKKDDQSAVRLSNPKTTEYEVVRTSLLPGLLKTICSNKHLPLPLRVFEVSDVVFKDASQDRLARNQRNVAAVYCNKQSGFELIHGLLDRLMLMMGIPLVEVGDANGYYIKESSNETFFANRRADVYLGNHIIGHFGILHPKVLEHFNITCPCSALEFNLEPFL